jgi:hypothetical protein
VAASFTDNKLSRLSTFQLQQLSEIHVLGLQALRTLLYLKGHASTFVERAVSTRGNGGKMDEHIFATFTLDKSKAFGSVKPLYGPCFFQNDSSCCSTSDVSIEGGAANDW